MATYLASAATTLRVPNKLKANGQPMGTAQWRNIIIPSGSRFSYYQAAPWLVSLCQSTPTLTLVG